MLAYFVNYGCNLHISSASAAQWRIPFALQMIPGLLLLIGISFQNESPRWLVEKNKLDKAKRALARVRARSIDDPAVNLEFSEIVEDFNGHEKMPLMAQVKSTFADRKTFYKFTMAITLMLFQQFTGKTFVGHCPDKT